MDDLWIAARFRCVDCGTDTCGDEYYMVKDEVWAASGLAPHGGMLCLADLERRIRRPLIGEDFTAVWPSLEAWERHVAARSGHADDHQPRAATAMPTIGKNSAHRAAAGP